MKQLVILMLVLIVVNLCGAAEIYVSVDGSAQPDGSLAKPYGSLPAALGAVRVLRKAGVMPSRQ